MNLVGTQCFDPSWKERIDANEKIKEIACDKFLEVTGEKKVAGLKYLIGEEEKEMAVDGIFVEIGSVPGVMVAQDLGVTLDSQSYIIVDGG
jgi:thioredoxin reductase